MTTVADRPSAAKAASRGKAKPDHKLRRAGVDTEAGPQSSAAPSPFPPIEDYAFLSNCHTGALVAPDGSIDWLCVPRFDSPSVFGSLLDRGAGNFRFGPYGIHHPVSRAYEPGSHVLTTTWRTPTGWLLVRDALTIYPRHDEDKTTPHTRPPVDEDADHLLVRTAQCISGRVEVEIVCEPVLDYGREPATWQLIDDELMVAEGTGPDFRMRLAADVRLGVEGDRVRGRHVLEEGEGAFCVLSWRQDGYTPPDFAEATARLDATGQFWREWLANARIPDHRWREMLQRSALTVKGLTYMPTGATVAALTTSLPETPGGERNWDYRFTWIRDTT
ncbi:MAG: glycoside hydrolase family 15 protein, partial [Catenulispora sp.]|nr:glycoside hydrolase family 15 protein [Catenulispora sp.]